FCCFGVEGGDFSRSSGEVNHVVGNGPTGKFISHLQINFPPFFESQREMKPSFDFVWVVKIVGTNLILEESIHERENGVRGVINTLKEYRLRKKLNAGFR